VGVVEWWSIGPAFGLSEDHREQRPNEAADATDLDLAAERPDVDRSGGWLKTSP